MEWDALRAFNAWDETKVRAWSEVSREAIVKKIRVHVGRICAIAVEKSAELAEGNPPSEVEGQSCVTREQREGRDVLRSLVSGPWLGPSLDVSCKIRRLLVLLFGLRGGDVRRHLGIQSSFEGHRNLD